MRYNLLKTIKIILLSKITIIASLIVGALITGCIIYFRFLRERPHGPLDSSYTSIKFWLIILTLITSYLFLIYVLLLPFYLTILIKEHNTQKPTENRKFAALFFKAMLFITDSITAFWIPIISYIMNTFPEKFVPFVANITKIDPYYRTFATIIYFLPPAIIAFIFLIETSYYKEYSYFPYSIFLMIFPIGWRGTLYMLRYFCEQMEEQRFSKTLVLNGIDPVTHKLNYAWSADASKYGITDEELQSSNDLYLEIYMKCKYNNYLKIFNYWHFHLVASTNKYFLQIFTGVCLFIAACIKLALLH